MILPRKIHTKSPTLCTPLRPLLHLSLRSFTPHDLSKPPSTHTPTPLIFPYPPGAVLCVFGYFATTFATSITPQSVIISVNATFYPRPKNCTWTIPTPPTSVPTAVTTSSPTVSSSSSSSISPSLPPCEDVCSELSDSEDSVEYVECTQVEIRNNTHVNRIMYDLVHR